MSCDVFVLKAQIDLNLNPKREQPRNPTAREGKPSDIP